MTDIRAVRYPIPLLRKSGIVIWSARVFGCIEPVLWPRRHFDSPPTRTKPARRSTDVTQPSVKPRKVNRAVAIIYGAVAYLTFLVSFLYEIGFIGNIVVPRSVDRAIAAPIGQAAVVDSLLLGLFAVQHSGMARPAFKRWWTRVVPQPIERSTYVLSSSLVLLLLYWQWRSMPTEIWDVRFPAARLGLWALFWAGWAIALVSTFMIGHFDLFGLRQVYLAWRGQPYTDITFRTPLLYRMVRHPLMLGFIIAFWAAPTMTIGRLLFAAAMTGYILIALQIEERDLVAALGTQYRDYRRAVPKLVPRPRRARSQLPTGPAHHETPELSGVAVQRPRSRRFLHQRLQGAPARPRPQPGPVAESRLAARLPRQPASATGPWA
ncbi:MAG: isoprenylcysteine carboxylmethyltransferase family protein [Mycobacterium sp.]|nr:isoprenylcysteine carboxylmethyltransferase family protein [Mycobacterium sp.]